MDSKQQKKETDSSETPPADTMTGRDLEKMLNKGVKPSDTQERLEEFVRWRIQEYNQNKWESLSDIFAEEFELFAKEDFEKLTKENIYGLRDCLRTNGVYVQKGISIAQALANVVQEDIPWPPDDEERPPPKQSQYYPPQQQPMQPVQPQQPHPYPPQQPVQPMQEQQPYRPENTTPLPPQPPYQPENTAPLPPQPPYQPIVEDTTPVRPPPTPIVEDTTPVHPPPTPSDGPPRQPQQQPEDTTTLFPPTTNYGPDYRVPHLLPSPYQVIQDFEIKEQAVAEDIKEQAVAEDSLKSTTKKSITSSSPVNTSQLSAVLRPRTISILREPTFSLSTARIQHTPNLAPPFASQRAHFLAPPFASQHAHFLAPLFASQHGHFLASPLGFIRDTEKRKAIGQG